MSPKIVDKTKRREELANLVYLCILKVGIKNFSIDSFIKEHKIGKSSFYNYFKSKDEAIYYVISLRTKMYIDKRKKEINLDLDFKENLYSIFDNYLNSNEKSSKDMFLYKEYFVIYQNSNNENLGSLNDYYITNMNILIKNITQDAIDKKILKKEALDFCESLLMTADGMMFFSFSIKEFDLKHELKKHIDNFINILRT